MKRLILLSLVPIAACLDAPTARDNLFDPASTGVAVIEGVPDTIESRLATYALRLRTEPALPSDVVVRWEGDGVQILPPATLTPIEASYIAARHTIRARIGSRSDPRVIERQVIVRQRPKTLQMECTPTCTMDALAVGVEVRAQVRDSLGSLVAGLVGDNAPVVVARDTSVAVRIGISAVARGDGSTYLVGSFNGIPPLRDSILITVTQRIVYALVICPDAILEVGRTFQIVVNGLFDRNNQLYRPTPPTMVWLPNPINVAGPPPVVSTASVSPEGLVTALQPGGWSTKLVIQESGRVIAECSGSIVAPSPF